MLGPDLNINGDIGEAELDVSSSTDRASLSAPDPQTPPTEGNSMLGKAHRGRRIVLLHGFALNCLQTVIPKCIREAQQFETEH